MNVLTDNEKGLLVLEHLGPKALAHDTMSLLEAFELGLKVAEQEVIKRLAAGVSVEPSYKAKPYSSLPTVVVSAQVDYYSRDQLNTAIAAARVQEREYWSKFILDNFGLETE